MSLARESTITTDIGPFLRAHPLLARALPDASVRWVAAVRPVADDGLDRAPAIVCEHLERLVAKNVVLVDGAVDVPDCDGDYVNVYRTKPGVPEWVDAHVGEPTTGPCGHTGVSNLGGGRYTCRVERCDAVFGPEAAKAVLAGGDGADG